ncbi:MAG: UDP-glucose dehydrogenase family protein [Candidatus Puniceispirillales bacterium]
MKIVMIGTGYVGLVTGTCFSEFGYEVICVDKDNKKINNLENGILPIYEPGLEILVHKNYKNGKLNFSNSIEKSISDADAIFIAVGTPERRGDGHADLTYIHAAAKEIAPILKKYCIIITKSTVPVGTSLEIKNIIKKHNRNASFDVVSNPEFLREGSAIEDFMRPNRVIIGCENEKSKKIMENIYQPLNLIQTPILFTDLKSAELIKYASNAFLAMKISFINQMADLCESLNTDIHFISRGMGLDKRIGDKFLHPGPGYGGSCFPKDTIALSKIASDNNVDLSIINNVISYNADRKKSLIKKLNNILCNEMNGMSVAILGLSFKPGTDDMRESPSLDLVPSLAQNVKEVKVFDPIAMDEASKYIKNVYFANDIEDCIKNVDLTIILTEWTEFRTLSADYLSKFMKGNIVVDFRNALNPENFRNKKFTLHQVGRGPFN